MLVSKICSLPFFLQTLSCQNRYFSNGNTVAIDHTRRRFFIKNIVVKCMKTDACHQAMSVYKEQAAQKEELLNMDLLTGNSGVTTVRLGQFI